MINLYSVLLLILFILATNLDLKAQVRRDSNQQVNTKTEMQFIEVDVSGSAGSYNGSSYTEAHLGVNLNFTENLTWRNSFFKRFNSSGNQDVTGLDSGVRYSIDTLFDSGSIKLFAGPGYRWAEPSSQNALFADAGVGINLGAVNLSGGIKYLRYDRPQLNSVGAEVNRDDTSYFLTVSGGKSFKF